MKERLRPLHTAHTGVACAGCMDIKDSLFQCSACKRAKYCNRECQKSSWSKHKPVCKLLQEFKTHSNYINQINGSQDPGTGVFKGKIKIVDQLIRDSGRLNSKESEQQWEQAKAFIFHSKICSICFKTDYEFDHEDDSKKPCWRNCDRCLFGWCCSDEHWDQYKHRHTPEICAEYVASSNINRFRYNHVKNFDETFGRNPDLVLSEPMENFPRDWDEYHRIRSPDLHNHTSTGRLPPEFLPATTKGLGQPATCLYGMYVHDKTQFCNAQALTIHVVGASSNLEFPPGPVWEEILHVLPHCKTMHVSFIGPELEFSADGTDSMNRGIANESCPDCQSKKRERIYSFHCATYHDYHASTYFTKPDFLVAFNTGMYEEYTESWKTSLRVILDLQVPSLFTSYCMQEAVADFKVLKDLKANLLTDSPVLNPVPDMNKCAESVCNVVDLGLDQFYQSNMYCICFKGRK
jgi:splicing suppressor protein 51